MKNSDSYFAFRRSLIGGSSALLIACAMSTSARAETANAGSTAGAGDEQALEEIVVTAERRSEDLQKVAASVSVRAGTDLVEQGRTTTQQILEDIPNVTFAASRGADNPNGNITIRGVQSTQQTGGGPGPSATATYVDDVYQGIGGDFDLGRVEVLRGPQGTLYGRSATGGVVAFHTNDPVLGTFGTDVYGEYGTADLRNGTAVVNLPIGDTLAVRVAAHEYERHGFWWNVYGGQTSTEEARIKVLYAPTENFRIIAAATSSYVQNYTGGPNPTLSTPDTINYTSGATTAVAASEPLQYFQYSLTANYDFGPANLTYVGAMHNFTQTYGKTGTFGPPFNVLAGKGGTPLDQFNTQELRLASDTGSAFSWIVGGNFYSNMYRNSNESDVVTASQCGPCGISDTNPGVVGAELFASGTQGTTKDFGLFTEETWRASDSLRVTGGVRYDRTQLDKLAFYIFNINFDSPVYQNNVGTCANLQASYTGVTNPCVYNTFSNSSSFNNVTYKARVEYDLTKTNMLYGMVSTGFLPGDAQISPYSINTNTGAVQFVSLPFNQERLTSFEVGSKNALLGNALQINGDVFYYRYQGYQEAMVLGQGAGGAPQFVVAAVPVRMIGTELEVAWKPTAADRIDLSGGLLDAQITGYPSVTTPAGASISTKTTMELSRLPGISPANASLTYEHAFAFANGSSLTPRVEGQYVAGQYLTQLTSAQVPGGLPYDWQSSIGLLDALVTWNSPKGTYALTAYGRNLTNKVYKSAVSGRGNFTSQDQVTPGEPRVYGVSVNIKY